MLSSFGSRIVGILELILGVDPPKVLENHRKTIGKPWEIVVSHSKIMWKMVGEW